MISTFDLAVLALASGRVAHSISSDEIFRPLRNWVYIRSAPVSDMIVTREEPEGDFEYPARMTRRTQHGSWTPRTDGGVRKPGFFGSLLACAWCLSLWTSLFWLGLYAALGHYAIWAAMPFALWAAANAYAKWLAS